jgi:Competence protein
MLEWVVHNDTIVHVRAFATVPSRMRPRVTCPLCGDEVRPHLGSKVRYHAAHRTDSQCSVAGGESALHLNIKLHLAKVLRDAPPEQRRLEIGERCEARDCGARHTRTWVSDWDEVMVETRVADEAGARIPDVLLMRAGVPLAGIEVFASHAVSTIKESALARLGVAFVEVNADDALIAEAGAWTLASTLPVVREGGRDRWRCERHARDTTRSQLYAARVVDLLFQNGTSLRRIYEIHIEYQDGIASGAVLMCHDDVVARASIASAAERDARKRAIDELLVAYEHDVSSFRDNGGALVDSPMAWATGAAARTLILDSVLLRDSAG